MTPIDHREWRAALLAIVNDRPRLEITNERVDEMVVGEISDCGLGGLAGLVEPNRDPLLKRTNRHQRISSALEVPSAAAKVIDHAYFITPPGEVHRLRPSKVAVAARYNHPHRENLH